MLQPDEGPAPRPAHGRDGGRTEPSAAELLRAYADWLDKLGHGQTPISRQQSVFDVQLPDKSGRLAFVVQLMRLN